MDFLEDEQRIADERDREELFDSHALRLPVIELPELQPVVAVEPETTVRSAIDEMVGRRVGCLLVVDGTGLVGVFSERDVLTKVAAHQVDLDATPVSQLMTARPETLAKDSGLAYALHKMTVGGYRHIPLLDDDGSPVKVVSMRDIVEYIVSLYPEEVLNLPDPDQPRSTSREGA